MAGDIRYEAINRRRIKEGGERREKFLESVRAHPGESIGFHCKAVGISTGTYSGWRIKLPDFAAEVTTLRAAAGVALRGQEKDKIIQRFDGNFVERRLYYFGFHTPWFQQETDRAYTKAKPGDIVLVLQPPEHGKTSFTEDHLTDHIARDKSVRITAISEGQAMARKISSRIMRRLQSGGPAQQLVKECGPFMPQTGEGGARQPWGVDAWSVYGADEFDERDFTFATGGWRSAVAGTRCDRLHVDDIQSKRSLTSTIEMWDIFRQDFLSRPGETGITTLNGTRVGEGDFYETMDDEFRGESFYQKIEYPALVIDHVSGELKPLWEFDPAHPERRGYTLESLERQRRKVGEDAWWRNYMQEPRTQKFIIFSEEGIAKSKNSLRSMNHNRTEIAGVTSDEAWLGLDPSIGGRNVVCAVHPSGEKLSLLDMQEDTDLPRNSAIAEAVDQVCRRISGRGWRPTKLVIEAMAFQKGLMEDESILAVAKRHGMRLESHLTGINKYDESIGIPSMASSFESGNIDLPYNTDFDQAVSDQFIAQLRAWKPVRDKQTGKLKFQRGNRLRQDQLMAFWFCWIWWTELRTNIVPQNLSTAFRMSGLPYTPTSTGLLIPR